MDSQVVTVDHFAVAMASIQEAIASIDQRIDGQTDGAPLFVIAPIQASEDAHAHFGSLVQALYDIEKGIARGLWPGSSHSDSNGKKPSRGKRPEDVGMPLSRAIQKLMEGGLLTQLAPRPVPQLVPP
ncbi:hypothetical protein CK203_081426 [Vitis vinifera]|uniref:Uncharacterized protein n=1 Tax=Vitis vinifera TaxID=29760 RepID=A0A438DG58_VITVI|nr:hypothetical protein CK203_081426 [Vitis vinifera]